MARRKAADRMSTRGRPSNKRGTKKRSQARGHDAFTVADLIALLRAAPQPDAEYWNLVEALTRSQPQVQPSAWGS